MTSLLKSAWYFLKLLGLKEFHFVIPITTSTNYFMTCWSNNNLPVGHLHIYKKITFLVNMKMPWRQIITFVNTFGFRVYVSLHMLMIKYVTSGKASVSHISFTLSLYLNIVSYKMSFYAHKHKEEFTLAIS